MDYDFRCNFNFFIYAKGSSHRLVFQMKFLVLTTKLFIFL